MSKGTIAILGSEGYLGTKLCEVIAVDANIVTFDKVTGSSPFSLTHQQFEVGTDPIPRQEIKAEVLIVAAAVVPLARRLGNAAPSARLFCEGVLQLAKELEVKRILYVSSSAIFGKKSLSPVPPEAPPAPFEPYGKEKAQQEMIMAELCQLDAIEFISVRPRTVVGDGRGGIFQLLGELFEKNLPVPVVGTGKNIYQFIHLQDLCQVIWKVAQTPNPPKFANVGAHGATSMIEHLEEVKARLGSKSKIVSVPRTAMVPVSVLAELGILPFAKYQLGMYGADLWFTPCIDENSPLFTTISSKDSLALSIEHSCRLKDNSPMIWNSKVFNHKNPLKWFGKRAFLWIWAVIARNLRTQER
mgnify:CR=1 FL=1